MCVSWLLRFPSIRKYSFHQSKPNFLYVCTNFCDNFYMNLSCIILSNFYTPSLCYHQKLTYLWNGQIESFYKPCWELSL